MEKLLVCQLMERTTIGYENARKEMREYLISKFNTEIKESMFRMADKVKSCWFFNKLSFFLSIR